MTIEIRNETTARIDEREFVELSRFVFEAMHLHPATEMSIMFIDEEAMEKLHVQWMGEPGATDVLSFPMDELIPGSEEQPAPEGLLGDVVDRKSTRLNSSHVAISYAVFCLKKKTRASDTTTAA